MGEPTYAQKWWNFLIEPSTILSIIGALIAGGIWAHGLIAEYSGIDVPKLKRLLNVVDSVSDDGIKLITKNGFEFKATGDHNWSYVMQGDGNFTIYEGVITQENLRFGTAAPSAHYRPPK